MKKYAISFQIIALGFFSVSASEVIARKTINAMTFNIRYDNPNDGENSARPSLRHDFRKMVRTIRFRPQCGFGRDRVDRSRQKN